MRHDVRAALNAARAAVAKRAWSSVPDHTPCPTPECPGDGRYMPPGRRHKPGCTYGGTFVGELTVDEDSPNVTVRRNADGEVEAIYVSTEPFVGPICGINWTGWKEIGHTAEGTVFIKEL